ncbi:hypothetical protein BDR03DRAFT_879239 [Suillus americanus]|nr:hypothetical protein BDR03DRAFT_879239 [Suillus americanus]
MNQHDSHAHDSLYLMDGNIVLIAPLTTGQHQIFRVHQSVLSKNSPVFKSMFMIPGVQEQEIEKYDGVPLVQLPDGAEEVESLLRVLYHESMLPFKRLDPNTPSSVKQVLTLANKYEIDHLRDRIVRHVEADWPQSLWQWDMLEMEILAMEETWYDEYENGHIDDYLPEPASAIRLARECNIPSILPAAFYHLSRLSIEDNRCNPRTSSINLGPGVPYRNSFYGNRTADWTILSSQDYICLLRGKAKLASITDRLFSASHVGSGEHSADVCSLSKELTLLEDIRETCRRSPDILDTLRRFLGTAAFTSQVCSACKLYIQTDLRRLRHSVWVEMPGYFGLT